MTPQEPPYKIVGLRVANVLKIKLVELTPSGDFITIGGDNANGKTSLLNSICMAIEGASATSEQPIRTGSTEGSIHLELSKGAQYKLGDLLIDVNYSASKGRKMTVRTREGVPLKSPQEILNSLYNHIALEPLAWLTMEPSKQLENLRKLVGLDFTKLDSSKSVKYTQRTDLNRQIDQKRARLVGMPQFPDAPNGEVPAKTLMEELRGIQKVNSDNAAKRNSLEQMVRMVSARQDGILKVKNAIVELRKQIDDAQSDLSRHEESLKSELMAHDQRKLIIDALSDQSEDDVNARIEKNDETNSKVRANQERTNLEVEISPLEIQSKSLTLEIEALDDERKRQLSEAKFPLKGLSFSDGGVTLNGIPFSQASAAETIVASAAIGIAMNPKLRVVLIRNASLIGPGAMKALKAWAEVEKVQILAEVVTAGEKADEATVVLSDGEILK